MKTLKFILSALFIGFTIASSAQVQPVDKKGLAIGGYDVVAYFSNTAVEGSPSITAVHKKVTYQFSTTANRDAFVKNPTQYLPQFDGFCAWGVGAKNAKFPINPKTFEIIDGKLYLFFNGPLNGNTFDSHGPWDADEANLLRNANTNWPTLQNAKN
jgi:hypothetical protein